MNIYFKNLFILLVIFYIQNSYAHTKNNHHITIKSSNKKLTAFTMNRLYKTELYKSFYVFLDKRGIEKFYIPRLFCIAKLESDLDPYAINFNKNGTFDVGLLQINSVWQKTCGKKLHDIDANVSCAKIVLKRQGLSAWVTYRKWGTICEKSLII